jgi:hypothetical protein
MANLDWGQDVEDTLRLAVIDVIRMVFARVFTMVN